MEENSELEKYSEFMMKQNLDYTEELFHEPNDFNMEFIRDSFQEYCVVPRKQEKRTRRVIFWSI